MKFLVLITLWIVPFFAQGQPPGRLDVLDYVLGPTDQILVRTPQVEKFDGQIFKIQPDGFVTFFPPVGRVRAGGLTIKSLERDLSQRLRQSTSAKVDVAISVVKFNGTPTRTPVK